MTAIGPGRSAMGWLHDLRRTLSRRATWQTWAQHLTRNEGEQ